MLCVKRHQEPQPAKPQMHKSMDLKSNLEREGTKLEARNLKARVWILNKTVFIDNSKH